MMTNVFDSRWSVVTGMRLSCRTNVQYSVPLRIESDALEEREAAKLLNQFILPGKLSHVRMPTWWQEHKQRQFVARSL